MPTISVGKQIFPDIDMIRIPAMPFCLDLNQEDRLIRSIL